MSQNGYGHIYVCLKNFTKKDKLSSLKVLHSKASLYGAVKFALFSGVSKEDVMEWFPTVEFEEKLITGHSPFEKLIQSLFKNNDDKSDFSTKIKIIFDKEERFPIYELSNKMKSNSLFILMSRAAVVNFKDLIKRAKKGDIFVATDVFPEEPVSKKDQIRKIKNKSFN